MLHSTEFSLCETTAALEASGVTRSYQAVFQWLHRVAEEVLDPPTASPLRIAIDETTVKIGTEQYWLHAAIDLDTKLMLGIRIAKRRGTDPVAAFLRQLAEKHDISETTFVVNGMAT